MRPGMIPDLALPGEMTPGQFGPISRVLEPLNTSGHPNHIQHRNPFRDANHQRQLRIRGFQNRVGRIRRWHKNHRCVRTGSFHGLSYSIEYRAFEMFRATLARRHPATTFVPYSIICCA